jgi:D-hydroxyproline dehydrogenase subunit gamma
MPEGIRVTVNRQAVLVPAGTTAAVAMVIAGQACRTSVSGELRGPVCGMGICFECRALIDGTSQCKSCQIICQPGMDIQTQE